MKRYKKNEFTKNTIKLINRESEMNLNNCKFLWQQSFYELLQIQRNTKKTNYGQQKVK